MREYSVGMKENKHSCTKSCPNNQIGMLGSSACGYCIYRVNYGDRESITVKCSYPEPTRYIENNVRIPIKK